MGEEKETAELLPHRIQIEDVNVEQTMKLRVQNICCGKEATLVKDTLNGLNGILSVHVNIIGRIAYIRHKPALISSTEIVNKLNALHLGISIMESGQDHKEDDTESTRRIQLLAVSVTIQTILFICIIVATIKDYKWQQWVAIPILLLGGLPMLLTALRQMRHCHLANVNLLMLIAVTGTIILEQWLDACLIVYVFSIADLLLKICNMRVEKSMSDLLVAAPETVVLADTNQVVKVKDVAIGTLILVCAGEQIPLDGEVIKGRAAVDESSITGEAIPVSKEAESTVFSGTIVQNGFLKIKTTCDYQSSTLSRVSQYIAEAQAGSSRFEETLNRFAKYYTPIVVITSLLFFFVPFIIYKTTVSFGIDQLHVWSLRALKVLVVACPCSLILAVPVTMISGITNAAMNGLLIKGAEYLEQMSEINLVCFDKTGTLTEGRFQVVEEHVVEQNMRSLSVSYAAALETKSSHPVASAIVNHYSGCITDKIAEFGSQISLPDVTKFKNESGMGLSGIVEEKSVLVGNLDLMKTYGISVDHSQKNYLDAWSHKGCTVVFVAVDKQLQLILGLSDKVRSSSYNAIQGLKERNVQSVMLTGDHKGPAALIADQVGLTEFKCSMKPNEKYEWLVNKQKNDDLKVVMIGDGVNDCPSLAAADVGIAIGPTATGLAVSSADITLMSDNLEKITYLFILSQRCRTVVLQNIIGSLTIKIVLVTVALSMQGMLWLAVLADVSGLLFVILNGIRPLYFRNTIESETESIE